MDVLLPDQAKSKWHLLLIFLLISQNSKTIHGMPETGQSGNENGNVIFKNNWKFLQNFVEAHLTHCHLFFIGVSDADSEMDPGQKSGTQFLSPPTKLSEVMEEFPNSKFSSDIQPAATAILLILEPPTRPVSEAPVSDLNLTTTDNITTTPPVPMETTKQVIPIPKVPPKFLPSDTFESEKWRNGLKKHTEFCTMVIFVSDKIAMAETSEEAEPFVIQNEIEREHKGRSPMFGQGFLSKVGLSGILNPRFYPLIKMDEDYFIFIAEQKVDTNSDKKEIIQNSLSQMEKYLVPIEISKTLLLLILSPGHLIGQNGLQLSSRNGVRNYGTEIILKKNCLLCPDSNYITIEESQIQKTAPPLPQAPPSATTTNEKIDQPEEFPQNVAKAMGWTKLRHFFPKTILKLRGRVLKVSVTTGIPSRISLAKIQASVLTQNDLMIGRKYEMTRGMYNYALREFAKKLNFTIIPFPSSPRGASRPGGSGNVQADKTWSGVIGDVFNYRADLGFLCGETVTRYSFTELAGVIEIIFLTFTTGKQSQYYSWKAIFWPYESKVWICCVVAFFFASILLYVVQKVENNGNTKTTTYVSTGRGTIRVTSNDTFLDCLEFVIFSFFEAPTDLRGVGRMKVQLISSFWCIIGVVLATVYRGSLTSLLAFPQFEPTPRDFAELAESDYKVALQHYGGSAYEQITYSPNPALIKIRQTMILEPSPYKCYKLVQDQKFGCIDYGTFGDYVILQNFTKNNGRSDLNMQHTRDYFLPVGPMFRRRSYLMESFRWAIGKVFDVGLTDWWIKMDYEDVRKKQVKEAKLANPDAKRHREEEQVILLTLKNFKGAFTIFFLGLGGGLLLFTGEWMTILSFYVADNFRIKIQQGRETQSAKWRRIARVKQQEEEQTEASFALSELGVPKPKTRAKKVGAKKSIQMATTKFIAAGHAHRKNLNLNLNLNPLRRPSRNPPIYATDEFGRPSLSTSVQMSSSAQLGSMHQLGGGGGGDFNKDGQNRRRQRRPSKAIFDMDKFHSLK